MSSKRKSNVIKSLPFDCWCEIVSFLSSTEDFHSVLLTVKGLLPYIQRLYPRCTENVVHLIRRIPPKLKSHVSFIRFSCNPSLFDFEKQKYTKDFFTMEESNKKEIEVSDPTKDLKKHLTSSSFGDDVVDFETLFSKLLSQSLFPNLLRLEIEVIEKMHFKFDDYYCEDCGEYHDDGEGEFIDPKRNITIENTVLTTSRVQNLKHLRLSLTCRKLSIKQVLSTVESAYIIRLGTFWVDNVSSDGQEEFDSFFSRYDLDVEWKEIFPRVKNLRLHCWILNSSQFRPISSQLENLWLDHVEFGKEQDRFRLSELKCKSMKLTGYSSTLIEDDGINDLENLVVNTKSLFMNYFTDWMFEFYIENVMSNPYSLSVSTLKNFSNLRVIELYNSNDLEFSFQSGEIVFRDLPKLEIIRLKDIEGNINVFNCPALEIFKFQFSDVFFHVEFFCALIMNGDFPKLRKLSAINVFLEYSSILCFSQNNFSSLVSLYVGYEVNDSKHFNNLFDIEAENDENDRFRENSSKERSVDLVISGFENLQKLKIGHLCLDRSVTGINDCPVLRDVRILGRLSKKFRMVNLPGLSKLQFGVSCFDNFVQKRRKEKITDFFSRKNIKNDKVEHEFHPYLEKYFLNDLKNLEFGNLTLPFSPYSYSSHPSSFLKLKVLSIVRINSFTFSTEDLQDHHSQIQRTHKNSTIPGLNEILKRDKVLIGGNLKMKDFCSLRSVLIGKNNSLHISNISTLESVEVISIKELTLRNCMNLKKLIVRNHFSYIVFNDKSNLPNLKNIELRRVYNVLVENLNNLETFFCGVCNTDKTNFFVTLRSCLNLKSAEFEFLNNVIQPNLGPNQILLQDLPKCKNLIIGPRRIGCDVFHIKNVGVKVLTVNDFLERPKPRDTQISLQIREFPFSVSGEEFPGLKVINIFGVTKTFNYYSAYYHKGKTEMVFDQLKNLKKLNTIVLKDTSKIVKLTSKMEGINLDTVRVVVGGKMIISLSEYLRRLEN